MSLRDGRKGTPSGAPDGWRLIRIFNDGSRLVRKEGRFQRLPPTGEKATAWFGLGKGWLVLDDAGRTCLKADSGKKGWALFAADLTLRGEARWRFVADVGYQPQRVRVSGQGTHAVWGTHEKKLFVHELKTGRTTRIEPELQAQEEFRSEAISPDGRIMASLTTHRVRLYDTAPGKKIREEGQGVESENDIAFLPNGSGLVMPTSAETVHLIPADPGKPVEYSRLDRRPSVCRFVLFPDGKHAVVRGAGGLMRVHEWRTGRLTTLIDRMPDFHGVKLARGSKAVAWSRRGEFVTWDAGTGEVLGRSAYSIKGHEFAEFQDIAVSVDGRTAAFGIGGHDVRLASVASGKQIARLQDNNGIDVTFRPWDGWAAFTTRDDHGNRTVTLLDPATGKKMRSHALPDHGSNTHHAYSEDGRFVLRAEDATFSLIETRSMKTRWKHILEESGRGDVARLDRRHVHRMAFDRASKRALVFLNGDAVVIDVFTGKKLVVIHDCGGDRDTSAFSASGRWLATAWPAFPGSPTGMVKLWDLEARHPAEPVLEWVPPREVTGLDLDADGKRLVTCHAEGACHVWDVATVRRFAPVKDAWDARAWERLASESGESALAAMTSLAAHPARAVPLLGRKLSAITEPPAGRIASWIADLESDSFKERSEAETNLASNREAIEGRLRAALDGALLERRKRLERLLRPLDERENDHAFHRSMRAVEVLERIGTKEARRVLERLAKGAPGAALTREAGAALERLR